MSTTTELFYSLHTSFRGLCISLFLDTDKQKLALQARKDSGALEKRARGHAQGIAQADGNLTSGVVPGLGSLTIYGKGRGRE